MTPLQAREALHRAAAASEKVASSSRWTSTYLAVFALAFAAATMIIGLVQPPSLGMLIFGALWVMITLVMVRWANQQRVTRQGSCRRLPPYWLISGGVFAVVLFTGLAYWPGQVLYWIPAAVLVGVPMAIGAVRERQV